MGWSLGELRDPERHVAGGVRAGDLADRQPGGRVTRRASPARGCRRRRRPPTRRGRGTPRTFAASAAGNARDVGRDQHVDLAQVGQPGVGAVREHDQPEGRVGDGFARRGQPQRRLQEVRLAQRRDVARGPVQQEDAGLGRGEHRHVPGVVERQLVVAGDRHRPLPQPRTQRRRFEGHGRRAVRRRGGDAGQRDDLPLVGEASGVTGRWSSGSVRAFRMVACTVVGWSARTIRLVGRTSVTATFAGRRRADVPDVDRHVLREGERVEAAEPASAAGR